MSWLAAAGMISVVTALGVGAHLNRHQPSAGVTNSVVTARYAGCALLELRDSTYGTLVVFLPAVTRRGVSEALSGVDVDVVTLEVAGVGAERVTSTLRDAYNAGRRVGICVELDVVRDAHVIRAVTVTDETVTVSAVETDVVTH